MTAVKCIIAIGLVLVALVKGQIIRILLGSSVGVKIHNETSEEVIVIPWGPVTDVAYHYAKEFVYGLAGDRLYRKDISVNASDYTATYTLGSMSCSIAVDWMHDRFYYSLTNSTIRSRILEGSETQLVFTSPETNWMCFKNMEVDPYQRRLFWAADGVLESCDLSGEKYQSALGGAELGEVGSVTLDIWHQRVFVATDKDTGSIYSMNYDGSVVLWHGSGSRVSNVHSMTVFKGFLYWLNCDSERVLYKAPVELPSSEPLRPVMSFDETVWTMKLMHRALQP